MDGFAAIGLFNPKSPVNIGAVLRAAGVYGAAFVAASGERGIVRYKKSPTDTTNTYKVMPLLTVPDLRHVIPYDCVPVAVELIDGAIPLQDYEHPRSAFYIFGQEDGTLGKRILSWCRDVVYVPGNHCMNLAATVNVVMYDRQAKILRTVTRQ